MLSPELMNGRERRPGLFMPSDGVFNFPGLIDQYIDGQVTDTIKLRWGMDRDEMHRLNISTGGCKPARLNDPFELLPFDRCISVIAGAPARAKEHRKPVGLG